MGKHQILAVLAVPELEHVILEELDASRFNEDVGTQSLARALVNQIRTELEKEGFTIAGLP